MWISKLLATVLPLLPALVLGYANPEPCSGDCFTHDPALIRRGDGTYFRFSSTDLIGIWTAPDLSGPWTRAGSVLSGSSVINLPGNTDPWVRFLISPYRYREHDDQNSNKMNRLLMSPTSEGSTISFTPSQPRARKPLPSGSRRRLA
jgi:hypothetical protein